MTRQAPASPAPLFIVVNTAAGSASEALADQASRKLHEIERQFRILTAKHPNAMRARQAGVRPALQMLKRGPT